MKDYLIWLNGGNCISGTAGEDELIKLKEYYKKVSSEKFYDEHEYYEFEDADGVVCVNLFSIQGIAIMKCTENKDIGFNVDSQVSPDDVEKCTEKFAKQLNNALQEMKR